MSFPLCPHLTHTHTTSPAVLYFSDIVRVAPSVKTRLSDCCSLTHLVYKSSLSFFLSLFSVPLLGCWRWEMATGPDAGVMSGRVIINIRNCGETKGPKWKGLAGWGDLTMSCTSVIFLVRLELSQGFNWNPDFKETPQPIQATPPPLHPPHYPIPTPPLAPLAGSTHVHSAAHRLWPRRYHRASPCATPGWNWLCCCLHRVFRCPSPLLCGCSCCTARLPTTLFTSHIFCMMWSYFTSD